MMMSKARVTPKRFVYVPRLELAADICFDQKRIKMKELTEYFWTDSKVVLGYIANDSRAFKTFVANRVQAIQEYFSANKWNYIPSEDNPADEASRSMGFKFFSSISRWLQGQAFLWEPQSSWERSSVQEINQNGTPNLEWKNQIKVSSVITKEDFISSLENRYSCWLKLKHIMAFALSICRNSTTTENRVCLPGKTKR